MVDLEGLVHTHQSLYAKQTAAASLSLASEYGKFSVCCVVVVAVLWAIFCFVL